MMITIWGFRTFQGSRARKFNFDIPTDIFDLVYFIRFYLGQIYNILFLKIICEGVSTDYSTPENAFVSA